MIYVCNIVFFFYVCSFHDHIIKVCEHILQNRLWNFYKIGSFGAVGTNI